MEISPMDLHWPPWDIKASAVALLTLAAALSVQSLPHQSAPSQGQVLCHFHLGSLVPAQARHPVGANAYRMSNWIFKKKEEQTDPKYLAHDSFSLRVSFVYPMIIHYARHCVK